MARKIWKNLSREALARLTEIAGQYKFSVVAGDLMHLDNGWYVTHTGLLGGVAVQVAMFGSAKA